MGFCDCYIKNMPCQLACFQLSRASLIFATMQPLLLLHGAIGAKDQLETLKKSLSADYKVYSLSFSGHGGEGLPEESFSIKLFADNVLRFMQMEGLEKASIFGYSMGGYVGMYLAKHHPDKVGKIVTLATKFHWTEDIAGKEMQMLDAEKIEAKVPAFAKALQERHAPIEWKTVLKRTAEMLQGLGLNNTLKIEDYTTIQAPALILLGDKDKMVTLPETVDVYKALPNAHMGMLPNTHHPIEQVDPQMLSFFIRTFIG